MCRDKNKFNEYADSFDEFGKSALSFSIRGREKIHSKFGLLASCLMYLSLFAFSVFSMKVAILHENPTIMEITELDQNNVEAEAIKFDVEKEFYAVALSSLSDGKIKHNPDWVEFEFLVWETKGSETKVV